MNNIKNESSNRLCPLWDALYEIYVECAKICDRHGLRYYAYAGTLLGAIRHAGFIPWDDDLDIAMPRPDYEKFIMFARAELPSHLKFWNWRDIVGFDCLFGKVQETRREVVEKMEHSLGHILTNGVYVDIFPIDGYTKANRALIKLRDAFLLPIERFRTRIYSHETKKGKVGWIVGMFMSLLVPWLRKQEQFCKLHEATLFRAKFDESDFVASSLLAKNLYGQCCYPRNAFGSPSARKFHNGCIMVPENPDIVLRALYGKSYMELPPVNSRRSTHQFPWHNPWWLGPIKDNASQDEGILKRDE